MSALDQHSLGQKWSVLNGLPRQGDYDLMLLSAESFAEISVAISPDGNRCLILSLPDSFKTDFRPIVRENLRLDLDTGENFVSIELLDERFFDLFDDLIVSIHNSVHGIRSVDIYCREFIQIFNKWSQFFDQVERNQHSESLIRGILGEIIVLERLIVTMPATEINTILEAWRGPYDQGNDFIFDHLDIEVKTRSPSNASVKIASESQLDQTEGKGLELVIVTLEPSNGEGQNMASIVRSVVTCIEDRLGDSSIFYKALRQKNLGVLNMSLYDYLRFKAEKMYRYDCCQSYFPSLRRSEIPSTIFGVSYSLNTKDLSEYLLEEIEL